MIKKSVDLKASIFKGKQAGIEAKIDYKMRIQDKKERKSPSMLTERMD